MISTSLFMIALASMDLGAVYAQENSTDWPGFLGANRDGRSAETGILKDWSGGKLKLAWKKPIGEGYGIGSVKAKQMFQFDFIDVNERLQCLDLDTGDQVWEFKHPSAYKDTFDFETIYYGEGKEPWKKANKENSSGQKIITLNKLKEIKTHYNKELR